MTFLKDLPIGSKVVDVDTKYKGKPIVWMIAAKNHEGYPDKSVTLINQTLETKIFRFQGTRNIDYIYSDLHRWLNDESSNFPVYKEAGYMYGFGKNLKKNLLKTKIKVVESRGSYGYINKYKDSEVKVFIPAKAEFDPYYNDNKYPATLIPDLKKILTNVYPEYGPWSWARDSSSVQDQQHVLFKALSQNANESIKSYYHPMINVHENIRVSARPNTDYYYEIIWNKPPTKPEAFEISEKITSRTDERIGWSASTDPENDPVSYKLERSLDGGDFVEIYKGSLAFFVDNIKDKGHKAVKYRVTALDSYDNESESLTSESIPVSDNVIPMIETSSSADLGVLTDESFKVSYQVKDTDKGQTWTVKEILDDRDLKSFDAKVDTTYTASLSADEWREVLNGDHTLAIEVEDSDRGKSSKEFSFKKDVRKLIFELEKSALKALDKMPERAILSMVGYIPEDAKLKVEITNNGLDEEPSWQDCTSQVLGNEKIFLSNKKKSAEKWAINIKASVDKLSSDETAYISSIGGFYD